MINKKKGLPAVKQNSPKRMTEAKRLLESKPKIAESQEQLFLEFLQSRTVDPSLLQLEFLWAFIHYLSAKGYSIIHGEDLLVAPFSKLAKLADLK